jgi:hypothetical protein
MAAFAYTATTQLHVVLVLHHDPGRQRMGEWWLDTGGQYAVSPHALIPSSHLSTKPV